MSATDAVRSSGASDRVGALGSVKIEAAVNQRFVSEPAAVSEDELINVPRAIWIGGTEGFKGDAARRANVQEERAEVERERAGIDAAAKHDRVGARLIEDDIRAVAQVVVERIGPCAAKE